MAPTTRNERTIRVIQLEPKTKGWVGAGWGRFLFVWLRGGPPFRPLCLPVLGPMLLSVCSGAHQRTACVTRLAPTTNGCTANERLRCQQLENSTLPALPCALLSLRASSVQPARPPCCSYVRLHTNLGDLNLELHCDICPRTCENFMALAEGGGWCSFWALLVSVLGSVKTQTCRSLRAVLPGGVFAGPPPANATCRWGGR